VIEFAVFLKMDSEQEHVLLLERIRERMNREAKLLGFPGAPANSVLILNDQPSISLDNLLIQVVKALARLENSKSLNHMTFRFSDLQGFEWASNRQDPDSHLDTSFAIGRIAQEYIFHMVEMGHNLDMAQQVAYTDAVSNLPNMRAALINLEEVLQNARIKDQPFSVLLIDGDNLRAANLISYAAGDEIIRAMGAVFKQNLRPGDYVARWRTGDEFIVTLPGTSIKGANIVGERFRLAVKNASRSWKMPVTISIGLASYPTNGEDINSLIEKAESANKCAKQQGKDQVVPAN
jgi:diguanylate cyclase (GGDEF)-like protein